MFFWDSVYVVSEKVHAFMVRAARGCVRGMRPQVNGDLRRNAPHYRLVLSILVLHTYMQTHTRTVACVGLVPFHRLCVLRVFQFLQVGVGNEKRASVENSEPGKWTAGISLIFHGFWSLGFYRLESCRG